MVYQNLSPEAGYVPDQVSPTEGSTDMSVVDAASSLPRGLETKVVVPKWQERVTFVGLFISFMIPTSVIFYVLLDTWTGNP